MRDRWRKYTKIHIIRVNLKIRTQNQLFLNQCKTCFSNSSKKDSSNLSKTKSKTTTLSWQNTSNRRLNNQNKYLMSMTTLKHPYDKNQKKTKTPLCSEIPWTTLMEKNNGKKKCRQTQQALQLSRTYRTQIQTIVLNRLTILMSPLTLKLRNLILIVMGRNKNLSNSR